MSRPKRGEKIQRESRIPPGAPLPDYSDPEVRREAAQTVGAMLGHEISSGDFQPTGTPESRAADHARIEILAARYDLQRIRVDPLNKDPLCAEIFSPAILGDATELDRRTMGLVMEKVLSEGTTEEAAAFFKRIVTLKRNAEDAPHPAAWVLLAYHRYIEEVEKEPTKPGLRKYICARTETYRAHPPEDDKSGWRDLWKLSGLFDLSDKVGRKP